MERTTTWTGKIGLMYASDYGYATSGGSTMNRTTCLNSILANWNANIAKDCSSNNWLFKTGMWQWTLSIATYSLSTQDYEGDNVISINDGEIETDSAMSDWWFSPAAYLKSLVKIVSGTGSQEDPFVLST